MLPTREIYWNISGGALIYLFALVALGFLATGVYRRVRLWRLGSSERRLDRPLQRLGGVLLEVFGHRRALRDPFPGIAHLLIFYGFLAQFIATSLISLQEWTGIHFLQGSFYLWYSLLSDGFGILGLVGLCMALWRRAVVRPDRLHSVLDDWVVLGLLLLVFVQGFLVEGVRIAITELHQHPDWARWSPGGYLVAQALSGLGADQLGGLHRFLWWFHAATAFVFIAYMAYGKLNHIWYGLTNIYLRNLGPTGKLSHPDIEALAETDPDAIEVLGTERIDQYSWKSLLDLDACMSCGRCEEVCPAHMSGVALSPRKLIRDMKTHLTATGPELLAARAAGGEGAAAELAPLFGEPGEGAPPAVLEEELWGCRTCGACQQECPVYIEHIPKMVDMRRHLVMTQSKMGEAAQQFLKNLDDRMHPWAGASRDREEWYQDLDLKVLGRGDRAEYLFWVGCTGAMIERNVAVTRAMVKVLQAGGVDFAILGAEEVCTGDPARRAGGELTFQICAKTNIETLASYDVKKIITTCPHCFNTYRNEYPDFGGHYEPRLRRALRGGPPHRADPRPDPRRPSAAHEVAGLGHLPRSLLPRASQRGLRRAPPGAGRAGDRRRLHRDGPEPLPLAVLRLRGGLRVDGRRSEAAHQPDASGGREGLRRHHRRGLVSLLHADVRRRRGRAGSRRQHPGRGPGRAGGGGAGGMRAC
jgi:ferredoxin/nitrate reductase gamma subunit